VVVSGVNSLQWWKQQQQLRAGGAAPSPFVSALPSPAGSAAARKTMRRGRGSSSTGEKEGSTSPATSRHCADQGREGDGALCGSYAMGRKRKEASPRGSYAVWEEKEGAKLLVVGLPSPVGDRAPRFLILLLLRKAGPLPPCELRRMSSRREVKQFCIPSLLQRQFASLLPFMLETFPNTHSSKREAQLH
jgi:hypothetical protein